MAHNDPAGVREAHDVVMAYLGGAVSLEVAVAACRALPLDEEDHELPEPEIGELLGIDPEALTGEQRVRYTMLVEALEEVERTA